MEDGSLTNNIEIIFNTSSANLSEHRATKAKRSNYDAYHDNDSQTHAMSNDGNMVSSTAASDDDDKEAVDEAADCAARFAEEKALFNKARQYINPGIFFRFFSYLYAERKLLTFFWVHFMATMVIWGHFALQKFNVQDGKVPEGAPRYWWKVMVPTLEFGAMHAILFQMALIPLTMSRFSISALSQTVVNRFVPMNRALRIHIHLGYLFVVLIFISTVLFLTFFGLLCSDGDQQFCNKMKSEIMITGYVILGLLLIVGGTSYFRHSMPYELFYGIHHLVFILYFITIIHTFDNKQRSGEEDRSQTFRWFSSTLLYYFCDRAALHLNHRYRTPLVASSVVDGTNGSKMVILRIRRPVLFQFKPGQFAYLRLQELDNHWHPFSIASGPGSSCLEFYIEVFDEKSWTCKLWKLLQKEINGDRRIEFEVMGPYGTCMAKTEDYSHAIAIGTGTGIVPILSLYKQHVRQLLRLEPESFLKTLKERQQKIIEVETAEEDRKGSIAAKAFRPCCGNSYEHMANIDDDASQESATSTSRKQRVSQELRQSIERHSSLRRWGDLRQNMQAMKHDAFVATRSIYGVVVLSILPVIGVGLLGLTISWNTCSFDLMEGMTDSLQAVTFIFQALFAFVAFFIWDGTQFFAFLDAVLCVISPFADWYWFLQYSRRTQLHPCDITLYFLLIGYMTARLWSMVVRPRHRSWRSTVVNDDGFGGTLDRLEMIWVAKSASLVSKIMPEIQVMWDTLVKEWGRENASKVLRIKIHITDKDAEACETLKQELADSDLFQSGAVLFGRPDFCDIIENHTLEMVCTRVKSYSLLAFCGSAKLASEIHHDKISNDMVAGITGNKQHQMEYVSESYGGYRLGPSNVKTSTITKRLSLSPRKSSKKNVALTSRRSVAFSQY